MDPELSDVIENDEDQEYPEVDIEVSLMPGSTRGLFTDETFDTPDEAIRNAKSHGLNLKELAHRHSPFDCFSFFKLINYIRTEKPTVKSIMENADASKTWDQEKYLKPVIEDDPLLLLGMEIDEGLLLENGQEDGPPQLESDPSDKGSQQKSSSRGAQRENPSDLERTIDNLRRELVEKDSQLEALVEDMAKMRLTAKAIIDAPVAPDAPIYSTSERDTSYANSYAHFAIHHEMLSDKVRTESYREALLAGVQGKHVLDLGCGTGILSMFSAKGGAASVTGIDMSDIAHQAMDIVRENGLDDTVTIVKGKLEEADLPRNSFDVIVSEWMGYFLLYEGMLDSVIEARKKYLSVGGRVLPNRCSVHLIAISDEKRHQEMVGFWSNVYGFKMSCLKEPSLFEASVEIVPGDKVISTEPATVCVLDIEKCEISDTTFVSDFALEMSEGGHVSALGGYFDTFFDLDQSNTVAFTTGPHGQATHWKQTVFYLSEKLKVEKGQIVKGKISVSRLKKDARSLAVKIQLEDVVQNYTLE